MCTLALSPDQSWDNPQILLVWHAAETKARGDEGFRFLSPQKSHFFHWKSLAFFTVIQTTTTTTTLIPEDFPRGRNHLWLLLVLFDFNSCFKVFKTHLGLLWVTGKDLATFTFQGKDSFGSYVNLHPRMASSIWMPDIFIDQVPPAIFNIVTWI